MATGFDEKTFDGEEYRLMKQWLCLPRKRLVGLVALLGLVVLTGCQSSDPPISDLQKDLAQSDWLVSRNAAELLRRKGANALPVLLQALKHKSPQTRLLAVEALGGFATSQDSHTQALSELLQTLRDKNPLVRRRAAESLGTFASHPIEADGLILALLESMRRDPDTLVRQYAAQALGLLKVSTKNQSALQTHVIPTLTQNLKNQSPLVVMAVAHALLRLIRQVKALNPNAAKDKQKALAAIETQAVLALAQIVERQSDVWVKASAAYVLGKVGAVADEAIPALLKALQTAPDVAYHNAAIALGRIGTKAFVPLKKAMKNPNPTVRKRVAYAFAHMNRDAAESAIHALERFAKHESDAGVKAMLQFSRNLLKMRHKR